MIRIGRAQASIVRASIHVPCWDRVYSYVTAWDWIWNSFFPSPVCRHFPSHVYSPWLQPIRGRTEISSTAWLRPRPHVYVFMRKRRLFCSFSPSVENGLESGDFRKRCVVVSMGENGDFWKRCWFENAYVWTVDVALLRLHQTPTCPRRLSSDACVKYHRLLQGNVGSTTLLTAPSLLTW